MKFHALEFSPEDLIFGKARYPLRYGINLEIGNGKVVPEIKYFPRTGKTVKEEYKFITDTILRRAVDLGITDLQLETELTFVETKEPKLARDIVSLQKEIIENYAREYGLNLGLRVTVADIRDFRKPHHDEEGLHIMLETFENVAESGADVLSIESEGGKELFNYAIIRQDLLGIVISLGVLAVADMRKLWKDIVAIAKNKRVIPGGDSACGFANTAMRLAGGLNSNTIPHTLAAAVRAMSASRSLVAYEEGARGPGKDCAYENVIIKAITGYPMSMEGKTSAVAHSSLLGNITAATCDLWSNEQVENIKLFGGFGPEVFLEILYYDVKLMNKAIETGKEIYLKELFIESDKYTDPQAYVLSPESACEIGKALVEESDECLRTVLAGLKATELMMEDRELSISDRERRFLDKMKRMLSMIYEKLPTMLDDSLKEYENKVKELRVRDYFE